MLNRVFSGWQFHSGLLSREAAPYHQLPVMSSDVLGWHGRAVEPLTWARLISKLPWSVSDEFTLPRMKRPLQGLNFGL